ncbi:MAG: hypothetical protein DME87_10675 [Verrucomicrobia bacterium]|nr:MAG: hypothetical protein DME87_10675 [Verrucomicrobiota bacterium]
MKRSFYPAVLEMMDRPQPVSAELERDLERIRQLNRWFGSYRLVLGFIRRWIKPGARLRIVDLATGSGDIPRLIINHSDADILEWKPAAAHDIALCTLTLHHFSNEDAVKVLRRCSEVATKFVLVSDLRRGFFLKAGVYILTAFIFRETMTRYDARLSAARAFSFKEFDKLARQAGWQNFGHKKFRFARQAIWLE